MAVAARLARAARQTGAQQAGRAAQRWLEACLNAPQQGTLGVCRAFAAASAPCLDVARQPHASWSSPHSRPSPQGAPAAAGPVHSALRLARRLCSSTGVDTLTPGHGTGKAASAGSSAGSQNGDSGGGLPEPADLLQVLRRAWRRVPAAPPDRPLTCLRLRQSVNVLQFRRQLELTTEDNAVLRYNELLDQCQARCGAICPQRAAAGSKVLASARARAGLQRGGQQPGGGGGHLQGPAGGQRGPAPGGPRLPAPLRRGRAGRAGGLGWAGLHVLAPSSVQHWMPGLKTCCVLQALPGTEDKVRQKLHDVQVQLEPLDQEKARMDRGANRWRARGPARRRPALPAAC